MTTAPRDNRIPGRVIGIVLSGTVLVLLNLVTAYLAVMPWIVQPGGAWDQDVLAGISAAAFVGAGLAVVTALLTIIPVTAGWLGKWWYLAPALFLTLAVARLVHLTMVYPDLPDNYGSDRLNVTVVSGHKPDRT